MTSENELAILAAEIADLKRDVGEMRTRPRISPDLAYGKNHLLNGNFWLSQRYAANTTVQAAGTTTFVCDRWRLYRTGAVAGAFGRKLSTLPALIGDVPSTAAFTWGRLAGDSNGNAIWVAQELLTADSAPFRGKYASFSVAVSQASGMPANHPLHIMILYQTSSTQLNVTQDGWTIAKEALITDITPAEYRRFTITTDVPLPNNLTQIAVRIGYVPPVGAAPADEYFSIVGAQLQPYHKFTGWDMPTALENQMACYFYYQKSLTLGTTPADGATRLTMQTATAWTPTSLRINDIIFPVPMRTTPSITIYRTADIDTDGKIAYYNGSAWTAVEDNSLEGINHKSFRARPIASGLTFGLSYLTTFHWTAEAEI